MLAYRINILCCGTSYSRVTSKMQRCLKRNQGIWKNNWQLKKMKVISPFYWQWSPTSCTLVSCHMLFMTKNSLYLINFQCTWQQGLIKLFPILNSRNTTTWHRNIHNLHTMWQQTQKTIRDKLKTTTPQPTLNLRHFPKALFFHYFLIKLNLGYLSSLLSLWVMATNRKSKPIVGKILKGKLTDLWKCNLKTLMASILGVVAFIRQPL